MKPVELQGSIPLAYFHFPSMADRLLIARAERDGRVEQEENAGPVRKKDLVRVYNNGKIHNYVLHPDNLSETVEQALENVKGLGLEHIAECENKAVEDTDLLKIGVDSILQGRDKNDMSNIRVMCILNTTNDADTLECNIRDSISALHKHCEKFHTDLDEQHKCTIEIHKGPTIPALHMSWRTQGHLMDSQQERYQVQTENKQQLDALYAKYVVSEHIRGSAEMRKKGDKNLDDAGVKEWLAKYKTKEGAPGTKSNAHELFYLDKEPLEEAIDFIVKHL